MLTKLKEYIHESMMFYGDLISKGFYPYRYR